MSDVIGVPSESAFDLTERAKSGPVRLLENRRAHLTGWLREDEREISRCETTIKEMKERAIAMMAELDEIERALNVLHAATKETE